MLAKKGCGREKAIRGFLHKKEGRAPPGKAEGGFWAGFSEKTLRNADTRYTFGHFGEQKLKMVPLIMLGAGELNALGSRLSASMKESVAATRF